MSYFDAVVAFYLNSYFLPLILFLVLTVLVLKNMKHIRQRFFAFIFSKLGKQYHRDVDGIKKELFKDLNNLKSADWELRNKGLIRVLEVGVGPGSNFEFYPPNSRVVVVEPNPFFEKDLKKNCAQFSHIKLEQVVLSGGEDLSEVKNESIDVVITTIVLCSVKDVKKVLQEIKRVLAPGGKYFFLEHVRGEKGSSYERFQRVLAPMWPYVFDGCCIDRDIGKTIQQAGFTKVNMKRFIAPLKCNCVRIIGPHICGTAQK